MKKTALVTGCAGFIGSHLSEHLLLKGYKVIGVDNLRTGVRANMDGFLSNSNFEFHELDINDPELPEAITKEIDYVYHLAAIASVKISTEDPLLVHDVNVNGTLAILELARLRKVKRFILASSAAVYGDPETLPIHEDTPLNPLSPYAASKIAAESYVAAYGRSFGIESAILRYFNVYGPRQENSEYSGVIAIFSSAAARKQALRIEGDGLQTRSFLFVEDVVTATILAGESSSASEFIVNVSGTESISIIALAKMIQEFALDSEIAIEHIAKRVGDIRDSIGNIERAKTILGFHPSIPLELGLQRTIHFQLYSLGHQSDVLPENGTGETL
ncbi:MAG: GDP-mannose 4,6-dehydratase [Candidatus Thorarchaeota archaeon]|nr:GDP-mannose 4,6-dehydratase [Candidatus Thorarchaeota archaeon]